MEQSHSEKPAMQRQGVTILIGLAILTVVEYFVATGGLQASIFLIVLIALAKVAMIGSVFMHAGKLFQGDEGGHS
jgi:cytochrome c oxidase subunit IV